MDLLCCTCCVFGLDSFPVRMTFQIFFALRKCLRMRINGFDLFKRSSRNAEQYMFYFHPLLSDNIELIFCKQIVDICHDSLRRIFNRKHCIIRLAGSNFFHRIAECLYVVAVDRIRKICTHGGIAVCALDTLKYYIDSGQRQCIDHLVVFDVIFDTIFCQELILTFAADCHDLLKQFLCTKFIKFTMRRILKNRDFILFPFRIQYLLACMYLVFCNILADFHSFFKKP